MCQEYGTSYSIFAKNSSPTEVGLGLMYAKVVCVYERRWLVNICPHKSMMLRVRNKGARTLGSGQDILTQDTVDLAM